MKSYWGWRKIESEYKPEVVYYSEGYDVSTISLKDQLPDLSVEINNKDSVVGIEKWLDSITSDSIKWTIFKF